MLTEAGAEIAGPLSRAADRLEALVQSGRLEPHEAAALREAVEDARAAAMATQQLARLTAGRLRQSHERIDLCTLLGEVLQQQAPVLRQRGLAARASLKPAEVLVDPSLLFGLLHTLLDWAGRLARAPIQLALGHQAWPPHAQLTCRFVHCPPDQVADPAAAHPAPALDTLRWRLLQQTARTMGLRLDRSDSATQTLVTIEFPRTVNEAGEGVSAQEAEPLPGPAAGTPSRPLAGASVLVIEPRRERRTQVREAVQHLGLILDFAGSIEEARDFCHGGLPHTIVYAALVRGLRLDILRSEILASVADFPFIEIEEQGSVLEISDGATRPIARVGREALGRTLPAALAYELGKRLGG
ncbi:hypothetical protein [Aquincola agrisoli]|uniref:hypothetical protein n=1 Tax=Aquincola TaxID=391952 RepID=UPI002FBE8A74